MRLLTRTVINDFACKSLRCCAVLRYIGHCRPTLVHEFTEMTACKSECKANSSSEPVGAVLCFALKECSGNWFDKFRKELT